MRLTALSANAHHEHSNDRTDHIRASQRARRVIACIFFENFVIGRTVQV
jgi:hypothetical protein